MRTQFREKEAHLPMLLVPGKIMLVSLSLTSPPPPAGGRFGTKNCNGCSAASVGGGEKPMTVIPSVYLILSKVFSSKLKTGNNKETTTTA